MGVEMTEWRSKDIGIIYTGVGECMNKRVSVKI